VLRNLITPTLKKKFLDLRLLLILRLFKVRNP